MRVLSFNIKVEGNNYGNRLFDILKFIKEQDPDIIALQEVRYGSYNTITKEMLNAQAKKYADLVKMYRDIVPKEQQYGITFWGFNDRDTWINRFFKMKDWPCIYNENLQPKPAFYGFLNAL